MRTHVLISDIAGPRGPDPAVLGRPRGPCPPRAFLVGRPGRGPAGDRGALRFRGAAASRCFRRRAPQLLLGPAPSSTCEMPACTTDESYSIFNPQSQVAPDALPGSARAGKEEAKPRWEEWGAWAAPDSPSPGFARVPPVLLLCSPGPPSSWQPEKRPGFPRGGKTKEALPLGAGAPVFLGSQENVRLGSELCFLAAWFSPAC